MPQDLNCTMRRYLGSTNPLQMTRYFNYTNTATAATATPNTTPTAATTTATSATATSAPDTSAAILPMPEQPALHIVCYPLCTRHEIRLGGGTGGATGAGRSGAMRPTLRRNKTLHLGFCSTR